MNTRTVSSILFLFYFILRGNSQCNPGQLLVQDVCEDCPTGKWSNINASECFFCPEGLYLSQSSPGCVPCLIGKFRPFEPTSECYSCPEGRSTLSEGSNDITDCINCTSGTYSGAQDNECIECSPGRFSNVNGSISCTVCPVGTFQDLWGQTICKDCPLGTWTDGTTTDSFNGCLHCVTGTVRAQGDIGCQLCPIGKFQNLTGEQECLECASGRFMDDQGQSSCSSCPIGTWTDIMGSISSSNCTACPQGTFRDSEQDVGCTQCERGRFSKDIQRTLNCDLCGSSSYNNKTGQTKCSLCSIGRFHDTLGAESDTLCRECPLGRFKNDIQSLECTACSPGTFSATIGSTECSVCPYASFSNSSGSIECSQCPSGFIATSSRISCQACPVGSFIGETGECVQCPLGTFNSIPGSLKCVSCPKNAVTQSTGSIDVSSCICDLFFYGKPFAGEDCQRCPSGNGRSCNDFNSTIPFIAEGYYRSPDDVSKSFMCIPPEACDETGYALETPCSRGYTGLYCGSCVSGEYFKFDFYCIKCPSAWVSWVSLIFAVSGVAYIMFRLATAKDSFPLDLKIAFGWIQILSVLAEVSTDLPPSIATVFHILSLSNFNFDVFAPECSVPVPFWTSWYTKVCTPIGFGLIVLVSFYIHKWRDPTVMRTKIVNNYINGMLLLIVSFYTSMLSSIFNVFNCYRHTDGTYVLLTAPEELCFAGDWLYNLPMIIVAVFVLAFGIPASFAAVFWKYRFDRDSYMITVTFEVITSPYNKKFFYWEIVTMIQKASFVVLLDFLSVTGTHFERLFFVFIILVLFIFAEALLHPYKTPLYNQLSLMWSFLCITVVVADGMIFSNQTIANDDKEAAAWFLILLLITGILVSCFTFFQHVKLSRLKREAKLFIKGRKSTKSVVNFFDAVDYKTWGQQMDRILKINLSSKKVTLVKEALASISWETDLNGFKVFASMPENDLRRFLRLCSQVIDEETRQELFPRIIGKEVVQKMQIAIAQRKEMQKNAVPISPQNVQIVSTQSFTTSSPSSNISSSVASNKPLRQFMLFGDSEAPRAPPSSKFTISSMFPMDKGKDAEFRVSSPTNVKLPEKAPSLADFTSKTVRSKRRIDLSGDIQFTLEDEEKKDD